jgi:hypothetical protein
VVVIVIRLVFVVGMGEVDPILVIGKRMWLLRVLIVLIAHELMLPGADA